MPEPIKTDTVRLTYYTIGDVDARVSKRPNEYGEYVVRLAYKGKTIADSEAFETDAEAAHGTAQAMVAHLASRVARKEWPTP